MRAQPRAKAHGGGREAVLLRGHPATIQRGAVADTAAQVLFSRSDADGRRAVGQYNRGKSAWVDIRNAGSPDLASNLRVYFNANDAAAAANYRSIPPGQSWQMQAELGGVGLQSGGRESVAFVLVG